MSELTQAEKNSKITVDQVADAIIEIKVNKAKNNPIEAERQKLVKRQLTVSYKGIYG